MDRFTKANQAGPKRFGYLYSKASDQGLFIAKTDYMAEVWGANARGKNTDSSSSHKRELGRSFDRAKTLLRNIQGSQDRLIKQWINDWVRQGILKPLPGHLDGNTIYDYYRLIQRFTGDYYEMRASLKDLEGAINKEKEYYKRMTRLVKQKTDDRNLIPKIKAAINSLASSEEGVIIKGNLVRINIQAIDAIVNRVCEQISAEIFNSPDSVFDLNSVQGKSFKDHYMDNLNQLIGKRLRAALNAMKKNETDTQIRMTKYSKNGGALKVRHKNGKYLNYYINQNGLQGFNIQEYIAAAFSRGGPGHTGDAFTRVTAKIVLNKENKWEPEYQKAKSKPDAILDLGNISGSNITVQISSKLYGVWKSGEEGYGGSRTSSGLSNLRLEGGANAYTRLFQLQQTLSSFNTYGAWKDWDRLRFGIVNLAPNSLIQGNVHTMERLLAMYFSAFMFNDSYSNLANSLPQTGSSVIYIFDVNGQFFTLGEICGLLLNQIVDEQRGDLTNRIKVKITPTTSSYVADEESGAMHIGGSDAAPKNPPFTPDDWYDVRNRILQQTKISAVKFDLRNLYMNAGLPFN